MSCFLAGALFFAVYNRWIVFLYPSYVGQMKQAAGNMKFAKKDVMLTYWHKRKWHKEKINLLWSIDTSENLLYLLRSWLNLLDEDNVMKKKVGLQAVLLSASGQQAYLSFDRHPFGKEDSTYQKLMWIEGLLRTVCENDIKLQSVYFLVHHHIMEDYHLDFSNPWPVYGFLTQ